MTDSSLKSSAIGILILILLGIIASSFYAADAAQSLSAAIQSSRSKKQVTLTATLVEPSQDGICYLKAQCRSYKEDIRTWI